MGYTPRILVLGGGVTGTAIARDLAVRGLDVTLVERGTLAGGATGRMQGLLYSGARQPDPTAAEQCIEENRTLREIASHCVTETGGLLVTTGDDDAFERRLAVCREAGIPAEELSGDEARSIEAALGPDVERALRVPDAAIDPFRLTVANARSAIQHDAAIRPHTELTEIHVEDGAIESVTVEHDPEPGEEDTTDEPDDSDARNEHDDSDDSDEDAGNGDTASGPRPDGGVPGTTGKEAPGGGESRDVPGMPGTVGDDSPARPTASVEELEPDYIVNATGPWADQVAGLAGFDLPLRRSGGTMVVTDCQPVGTAVSRYGDGGGTRTIVPHGRHCVVGQTDERGGDPDAIQEGDVEIDVEELLDDAAALVPDLANARLLRSFRGVRAGPPGSDSEVGFALVDHAERDGCWGMTTVVGGTLTTHRLVAERVADHVCGKFGITRTCRTDEMPLPGSESGATDEPNPVVCESESVTRAEIRDAIGDESATPIDLNDVRIRTAAAMGSCQGGRCGHRIAAELHPDYEPETVADALGELLAERWKGQRHALWGEQLTQAARNYRFHAETLSRKYPGDGSVAIDEFDDGPGPDDGDGGPPIARRRGIGR
jgi:glycerol-3-phosphate dehydrogenase